MVKLFCASVGIGSVFPVDIDISETVGDLKEKIKEKNPNSIGCDAALLNLYLARKGNDITWLNLEDGDIKALKKGEIPNRIKSLMGEEHRMLEAWDLNDENYFGTNFNRAKGDIHVLVELPNDMGGGARGHSQLARIEQKVDHLYKKSTTVIYNLSRMSSTKGRELRQQLHIHLVDVETVPFFVDTAHPWSNSSGRPWKPNVVKLSSNIPSRTWQHKDLLRVKIPGHNIELAGRTNLLILSKKVKKHPYRLAEFPDVRMLIEVKQEISSGATAQTISELIALDLLTDAPVMALLTDLMEIWQFFWVSEKSNDSIIIHTAVLENPGDAFEVIRTLLQQPTSVEAEIQVPCFERPVKRRKLAGMLRMMSENDEGAIRDAIERYYDIASVLGPDIQMARAVASQITRAIPAFSNPSLSYFS